MPCLEQVNRSTSETKHLMDLNCLKKRRQPTKIYKFKSTGKLPKHHSIVIVLKESQWSSNFLITNADSATNGWQHQKRYSGSTLNQTNPNFQKSLKMISNLTLTKQITNDHFGHFFLNFTWKYVEPIPHILSYGLNHGSNHGLFHNSFIE